ncbi:Histone-lysine N-methyltransferase protein [Dioscorea alata]|uniref:Histone-lysine N-methyltransferase protein n=1 Tax=Dioscorea alata TaxID=55571 RepID=A0ACB7UMX2_DIOAL|nr:Histone-lysine N-methyltransferase protein [Dioscorea alata]
MAFHVACPITCRRICKCELGNAGLGVGEGFLEEVVRVEEFLKDPWVVRVGRGGGDGRDVGTVQVLVPKVVAAPPLPVPVAAEDGGEDGAVGATSVLARRAAMQRQAVAASMAAEDYVRRLEAGGAADAPGEVANNVGGEDQGALTPKIMCRICFSGEDAGSEKAAKMLTCKTCDKKYHRSCLKIWAEYRDLFHWSSWVCPSCRTCEVCRRGGDPTKLMYCKRCDGAYHCYCQQPPHKNVSHGPYLCPKHTRCHSCGSTVSGNGLSTRWFLGYTCCDACGRLFVKGNYCPVCLKVYRDSESTPMVCCDVCQQWVHCLCDGISDEKYQQFQADGNLQYKCAACRGDCYQVKDIDDAVRELWRRRDKADKDLIANLRAAAGLPSQEEIFSLSPFSDDEETSPAVPKHDHGRSLKFSVKGLGAKNSKEYGKTNFKNSLSNKKHPKKGFQFQTIGKMEGSYQNIDTRRGISSLESSFRDQTIDDTNSHGTKTEIYSSPLAIASDNSKIKSYDDHIGSDKNSSTKEAAINAVDKVPKVHIKGGKHRNTTCSPVSENVNCQKEQDSLVSNGARLDNASPVRSSKYEDRGSSVKLAKVSDAHRKGRVHKGEVYEPKTASRSPLTTKARTADVGHAVETVDEEATLRNDQQGKHAVEEPVNSLSGTRDAAELSNASNSSNDPKPLLKLKFKNPYFEQRSSWVSQGVEEKSSVKGQRSKRKRPSAEKISTLEDDASVHQHLENSIDEVMDAKILQKLGKGAIGKRVEIHQSADNSWHKGMVSNVVEGTSSISVDLDDGRTKTLELGKQGVRFISQKQKRART